MSLVTAVLAFFLHNPLLLIFFKKKILTKMARNDINSTDIKPAKRRVLFNTIIRLPWEADPMLMGEVIEGKSRVDLTEICVSEFFVRKPVLREIILTNLQG